MSQPDLVTRLREARPVAPPELRERVRLVAERAPQPPRRLSWRLGVVVAFAAALAVVAAVLATRGGDRRAEPVPVTAEPYAVEPAREDAATPAPEAQKSLAAPPTHAAGSVAPSATRLQRYRAYLELRVARPADVSKATQRALSIARSLGGYPLGVAVDARGRTGAGTITLRIPRHNVQEAVTRLSALGTILASNVQIEDLQAQVNTTDTRIDRLQRRLRELRAQKQTPDVERRIESLTRDVQRLQRARASTVREAQFATVQLQLTTRKPAAAPTPHEDGPFHGLAVAFRWIGIVAVYALALGAPLVVLAGLLWLASRAVRRRREEALLSSP
jgi:hypothetical protein